jgi:hypothetical protein
MKNNQNLARISPSKAEDFLFEIANLRDDPDSFERFRRLFNYVIPIKEGLSEQLGVLGNEAASDVKKALGIEESELQTEEMSNLANWFYYVQELRKLLRLIWREPDLRTKEYGLFLLQQKAFERENYFQLSSSEFPIPLPFPGKLEQAFLHLRRASSRVRYCSNPDCLTPYFFAKRRNQKYCSDACAIPAQREAKRQWWAENGEEWRATRQKASTVARSKRQKVRK